MISFSTVIRKFEVKAGWTYIDIPSVLAQKLKPGNRQSFRVKGTLDKLAVKRLAVMPVGDGGFIIPLNATLRKGLGKRHGATLRAKLEEDKTPYRLDADLVQCLAEEPGAREFFMGLSKSHREYFSKWIGSAKTESTKAQRIARCLNALLRRQNYPQMLHWEKKTA